MQLVVPRQRRGRYPWGPALIALLVAGGVLASDAEAQTPAPPPPPQAPSSPDASAAGAAEEEPALSPTEQRQIRAIERKIDAAQRYLNQLGRELERVGTEAEVRPAPTGTPRPPPAPRRVPAPPPPPERRAVPAPPPPPERRRAVPAPPPPPVPTDVAREEAAREEEEAEELGERGPSREQELPEFTPEFLAAARAVLIPQGVLETSFRVNYNHNELSELDIRGLDILETVFIGRIRVGEIRQDSFNASLGVRFGIADRLQFNLNVPYGFRYTTRIRPPGVSTPDRGNLESKVKNSDFGDVEFGFSYHLLRESDWWPDTIMTLGVKTDSGEGPFDVQRFEGTTGTGFWGLNAGISIVKVSDPGSVFASFNYLYHIRETTNGLDIDPADNFGGSIGFALALNPFFSINFAGLASYTTKLKVNSQRLAGTDRVSGSIAIGGTYGVARNFALDVSFTYGLTPDASDFGVRFGIPFRWNLNPQFRRITWKPALKVWDVISAPLNFRRSR